MVTLIAVLNWDLSIEYFRGSLKFCFDNYHQLVFCYEKSMFYIGLGSSLTMRINKEISIHFYIAL